MIQIIAWTGNAVALAAITSGVVFYAVLFPRRLEIRKPERRACLASVYALVATGLLALYQGPLHLRLDALTVEALSLARSWRDLMVAAALLLWGWAIRRELRKRVLP